MTRGSVRAVFISLIDRYVDPKAAAPSPGDAQCSLNKYSTLQDLQIRSKHPEFAREAHHYSMSSVTKTPVITDDEPCEPP